MGIDNQSLLMQGDSLVSLANNKNEDFWKSRICISVEVFGINRENKRGWGSLFYKNWHILNTKYQKDKPLLFNYKKHSQESHNIKEFFIDNFIKTKTVNFMSVLQEHNAAIRKSITKRDKEIIQYDPEKIERLRALGYLQ